MKRYIQQNWNFPRKLLNPRRKAKMLKTHCKRSSNWSRSKKLGWLLWKQPLQKKLISRNLWPYWILKNSPTARVSSRSLNPANQSAFPRPKYSEECLRAVAKSFNHPCWEIPSFVLTFKTFWISETTFRIKFLRALWPEFQIRTNNHQNVPKVYSLQK